jgi:putative ABC transport system permease protein
MWLNTLLLALRSIRRNLMRSFLTILGIVIGVGAVITMVTLGNGATMAIQNQISGLGTNLLQVRPGQRMGPGGSGRPAFRTPMPTPLPQIGGITAVAPEARTGSTVVANGATGPAASSAAPTNGCSPATGRSPKGASSAAMSCALAPRSA